MKNEYYDKRGVVSAFHLTDDSRWNNRDWPRWMHLAWQYEREVAGSVTIKDKATSMDILEVNTAYGYATADIGCYIVRDTTGSLTVWDGALFEHEYGSV